MSSTKTRPSIVFAEDNSMMSARVQLLLAPGAELVATVADGCALLAAVRQYRPDVIVTDIHMPCMTGLEAARHILAEQPKAKIVFVTAVHDAEVIRAALALGGLGFVAKRDVGTELVAAVQSSLEGKIYISKTGWQMFGPKVRPDPDWGNRPQ